MRYFVAVCVVLLLVAHQDYWNWDNTTLVFGFLPGTLAWHMGVSVAASVVWLIAVKFCWPMDDEVEARLAGKDGDA